MWFFSRSAAVAYSSSSKADDRQRSGRGRCQSFDFFGKQIGHDAKTGRLLEHETDHVRPGDTTGMSQRE